jgi:hypothetical protein
MREFGRLERLCKELYFTLQTAVDLDLSMQESICQVLQ